MRNAMLTALTLLAGTCAVAQSRQEPMAIEVFPFELEDRSAGAGILPPDEHDRRYLSESARMTKSTPRPGPRSPRVSPIFAWGRTTRGRALRNG